MHEPKSVPSGADSRLERRFFHRTRSCPRGARARPTFRLSTVRRILPVLVRANPVASWLSGVGVSRERIRRLASDGEDVAAGASRRLRPGGSDVRIAGERSGRPRCVPTAGGSSETIRIGNVRSRSSRAENAPTLDDDASSKPPSGSCLVQARPRFPSRATPRAHGVVSATILPEPVGVNGHPGPRTRDLATRREGATHRGRRWWLRACRGRPGRGRRPAPRRRWWPP